MAIVLGNKNFGDSADTTNTVPLDIQSADDFIVAKIGGGGGGDTLSGVVTDGVVLDPGGADEATFSRVDGVDGTALEGEFSEIWVLWGSDIPAAGTYDVEVTLNETPSQQGLGLRALQGAAQELPTVSNTSAEQSPNSISTSVSASAGDFVFDALLLRNGGKAASADGDQVAEEFSFQDARGIFGSRAEPSADGTVTMSWSWDGTSAGEGAQTVVAIEAAETAVDLGTVTLSLDPRPLGRPTPELQPAEVSLDAGASLGALRELQPPAGPTLEVPDLGVLLGGKPLLRSVAVTLDPLSPEVIGGTPTDVQLARPAADLANPGVWTDEEGGGTEIYRSIDEAAPDDADYVVSTSETLEAPEAPGRESITIVSETETEVTYEATWGDVMTEAGYEWKAGGNNEEWTRPTDAEWGELPEDETSVQFTVARQAEDVDSFFCVRAFNSAGVSEQTCYGFTLSASEATTAPADPTGLSATTVDDSQVDLAWTDNADNEDGYRVHRSTTQGFTPDSGNEVASLSANVESYSDTGLAAETTYYYRVVAHNSAGTGTSSEASATTDAAPTGADPDLVEDFSTYTSTSDMLSDPRGIYTTEDQNDHLIDLDTGEGLDAGGFSLSQSMRYTWEGSVRTIGRVLNVTNNVETWIEVWAKFSSNWKTDWGNPDANPDYKWIFGLIQNAGETFNGRFEFKTGRNGDQYSIGTPATVVVDSVSGSSNEWDGEWHRFRIHFKHESSDGACDGTARADIVGRDQIGSAGDVCTERGSTRRIRGVALGRNLNHGLEVTEDIFLWWGRVAVWWNSAPSWHPV